MLAPALFFGLLLPCAAQLPQATLRLLDLKTYPQARCLDGSAAGYYFLPASNPKSARMWVISLEGGGECVDQPSCVYRANSSLGSSTFWNQSMYLGQYQSNYQPMNPDLYTYNMVFIKYCSGDLFLGTQGVPNTWGIQFSGHYIVQAVLRAVALADAQLIVWTGDSAGGIACLAYVDFVQDMFPKTRVVGAPIGGFYFSNNWTYTGPDPAPVPFIPWDWNALQIYAKLWEAWVPERCMAERPLTPWQCILAEGNYPSMAARVFIVEGHTDRTVMPLHAGLTDVWDQVPALCDNNISGCPAAVLQFMGVWGDHMHALAGTLRPADGLFMPSCLLHCGFTWKEPIINNLNYIQAFGNWLFSRGGPMKSVDSCGVMCNPTCVPGPQLEASAFVGHATPAPLSRVGALLDPRAVA